MFSLREAKDTFSFIERGLHEVTCKKIEGVNPDYDANKAGYILVTFEDTTEEKKNLEVRWYTAKEGTEEEKKKSIGFTMNKALHLMKIFLTEAQARNLEGKDFVSFANAMNKSIKTNHVFRLKVTGRAGQDGKVYSTVAFPPFAEQLEDNKLVYNPNDPNDNPLPALSSNKIAGLPQVAASTSKEDLPF